MPSNGMAIANHNDNGEMDGSVRRGFDDSDDILVYRDTCYDGEIIEKDGHSRTSGNVAIQTKGRMLRVRAAGDYPHLVSLGNDRFSTAVTVHQLPKGRVSVGSSSSADIRICGTGVREVQCWIENDGEGVIVYPNGVDVAIQIDGVNVTQPSRLYQGCMLRFGRSNFFRFNHPQEAKYMRSVLPANTRVSMMPNAFYPNDLSSANSKTAPNSNRSYDSLADSWYDLSSDITKEDLLSSVSPDGSIQHSKCVSPKAFLPGSSTLNSPASVVLSRHKQQPGNTFFHGNGPFSYNSVSVYEDQVEKSMSNGKCADRLTGDQNNNHDRLARHKNKSDGSGIPEFSSCESLSYRPPKIIPPSPAFDRNPSYSVPQKSSPNNDYGSFSISCSPSSFSSNSSFSDRRHGSRVPNSEKNESLSSPLNGDQFDSPIVSENNGLRKMDSETKRKQAHQNRILEQERERVERLRLEEILTACVDYEKQAQYDGHMKPQNRIKTNGSLSRDKPSLSPSARTPESPKDGLAFTFDKSSGDLANSENDVIHTEKLTYQNSPRTRIKTVVSPKIIRKEASAELLGSRLTALDDQDVKKSPTTRRTNVDSNNSYSRVNNTGPTNNSSHQLSRSTNLDNKTRRKYEFLGIDPTAAVKSIASSKALSQSYHGSIPANNDDECTGSPNVISVSVIDVETSDKSCNTSKYEPGNYSSNEYSMSKSQTSSPNTMHGTKRTDEVEKLNGLVSDLNHSVKNSSTFEARTSDQSEALHNVSKFILPLEEIDNVLRRQRFSMKKCELKKLQSEQNRLMEAINKVKNKLLDIQRQKDEIIRELEMEKALLEGELKAENEKLTSEEALLSTMHERMTSCEKQIETCSRQQRERQHQNKSIIDEQQNTLSVLQSNLACIKNETDKASIIESIAKSREILEEETKSFEDFEFRLLEEEALLLSRRDEYLSDLSRISSDLEHTRTKISNLYSQKEQLLQNASDEIKSLELQVRCHTRTLQQNHSRLQDIGSQLKETFKSFSEIHENGDDSCNESLYPYKSQSQEDLDRISRVTSDAPIMENGSTNSLGRRTIASLQQIERNRQLHLAQQGSQVIEEERKRMVALKQRVQDEVKAQWEEGRKQREHNCSSITSIGSDNSSVLSSDRIIDSVNNGDDLPINKRLAENGNAVDLNRTIANEELSENAHLRSEYPSNEPNGIHEELSVVLRASKSTGSCQRLEPRFSVYRRKSLDLRQHIEGAGHQVEQCPYVFVDKTSCRGYLQKMTTKFRTWNKRWFVFDRKKCSFAYYGDKSEKKCKGAAHFQDLLDLLCMDNNNLIKSSNPSATFIVKSRERVFYLLAPSIEAMRIWFDVLATEIEAFLDS